MNVALLLALFGGPRTPTTVTFASSQTWVAPASVNLLARVDGVGQAGTAPSGVPASRTIVSVAYSSDSGPEDATSGTVTWDALQGFAPSVAAAINGGGNFSGLGAASINFYGAGPRYTTTSSTFSALSVLPGSASVSTSGGWTTSGTVASSGSSSVSWLTGTSGASGASASGFGFTFPGGTSSTTTAVPVTHTNVAVTPGAGYAVVVPLGGSVTITYY